MAIDYYFLQNTKELIVKSKSNILYDLLYISLFLIYFKVLPLNVETQPILTVILSLVILIRRYKDYFSNQIKIYPDELGLIFLVIILLIYTLFQYLFWSEVVVIDFIKYFIGIFLFLAIRRHFKVNLKVFYLVVIFLVVIGITNLVTPELYNLILGGFIPRTLDSIQDGLRGINILTPEPSYFAAFELIILNVIESQLDIENIDSRKKYLKWSKWAIILLAFLTKSAYVISIALVFLIPAKKYIKTGKILKFGLIIGLLIGLVGVSFLKENRLFQIFDLVYYVIKDGNIDYQKLLFEQEASGGTRIVVNFLAFSSLFIKPLGSGLGSFPYVYTDLAKNFNLDLSSHEVLGNSGYSTIYAQTYFANLCNDVGVFSLILLFVVFVGNSKINSQNVRRKRYFSLFVLLFFQSQITSPAFWIILFLAKNDRKII
jgi:hypothetical protein